MKNKTDYRLKIKGTRPRLTTIPGRDVEEETESNRGRILQSQAVRWLQQKTQVFPLEINAAVRTRLTHSLEVQQTGRFLAREILCKLGPDGIGECKLTDLKIAFTNIVEMASLMHDIGNPPFGHFGEVAINEWIQNEGLESHDRVLNKQAYDWSEENSKLRGELRRDISTFEGNAQAIRLVHTLQDLNLTYCQTAALLKYTRPAYEKKPVEEEEFSYLRKKPGYYFSEKRFVAEMRGDLDMGYYCRHPLAYIMEAADDISYCIADLEDGVQKKLMTLKKLKQVLLIAWGEHGIGNNYFSNLVTDCFERARQKEDLQESHFIINFRTALVKKLIDHASIRYIKNHQKIFDGTFNEALLEGDDEIHKIIKTLKTVAQKYIFNHSDVETLELRGYAVIRGLFSLNRPLLELDAQEFCNYSG